MDEGYVEIVEEANKGYSTDISCPPTKFRMTKKKGVRQGDPLSAKLFTALLEIVFSKLKWEGGISISAEQNYLRFADVAVFIANSAREVKECYKGSTHKVKKWA